MPGQTPSMITTRPGDLLKWIESQAELAHLKKAAGESTCIYYPNQDRIIESSSADFSDIILQKDRSKRKRILEAIGIVSARELRGNSYSSKGFDRKLANAALAISFCNLWDFISGLPVINLMFIGILGSASWAGALFISWIILIIDRETSRAAINRSSSNISYANVALSVFIALSLIRTFFAGVGFDLLIGKQGIATRFAAEVASEQLKKEREEYSRLIRSESPQLKNFTYKCKEYTDQLSRTSRDNPRFDTLYLLAYGTIKEAEQNKILTHRQLLSKYGGQVENIPGDCNKQKVQIALDFAAAQELSQKIDRKTALMNSMPPLKYLESEEKQLFDLNFKFINKTRDDVEFRNGLVAVGQATKQFYGDLRNGRIAELGLSLMWMLLSIVLCYLAVRLLWTLSLQTETKASFDESLRNTREKLLSLYRKRLIDYQVQQGMIVGSYTEDSH